MSYITRYWIQRILAEANIIIDNWNVSVRYSPEALSSSYEKALINIKIDMYNELIDTDFVMQQGRRVYENALSLDDFQPFLKDVLLVEIARLMTMGGSLFPLEMKQHIIALWVLDLPGFIDACGGYMEGYIPEGYIKPVKIDKKSVR